VLKVEKESELIIGVFIEAIEKGDWRAAEPLLRRVYGRPQEKVEVSQPQSVAEVEAMSLSEELVRRAARGASPQASQHRGWNRLHRRLATL
jgi:hypothetical protein